jgi:hypothetical protein
MESVEMFVLPLDGNRIGSGPILPAVDPYKNLWCYEFYIKLS